MSETPVVKTPDLVVRAFELPVNSAEPDGGWDVVRECWRQATCLANWCVQRLIRNDHVRLPGHAKWAEISKMPYIDLYALAFGRAEEKVSKAKGRVGEKLPVVQPGYPGYEFFVGAKKSAGSIINAVRKKYEAERFAVLWCRDRNFSTYKYPTPWVIHAEEWKAAWQDADGRPSVRVAMPGGQVTFRLRGGPEFGRQMSLFTKVCKEELPRIECSIRERYVGGDNHRHRGAEAMFKMVARLPVTPPKQGRCLVLLTDPEAFWVGLLDGRPAWVMNRDDVRRRVAAHESHLRTLRRLSEDSKAERRGGSNRDRKVRDRLDALCVKDRRRLDSLTHELTAHVVRFCVRQGVSEVFYLDRDKGYTPSFPWHALHSKLASKLQRPGDVTGEGELPSIALYSESGLTNAAAERSIEEVTAGPETSRTPVAGLRTTKEKEDETWRRVARLREAAARKVSSGRSRKGSHPAVSAP